MKVRRRNFTDRQSIAGTVELPLVPLKSVVVEIGEKIDFLAGSEASLGVIRQDGVQPCGGAFLRADADEIGAHGAVTRPACGLGAIRQVSTTNSGPAARRFAGPRSRSSPWRIARGRA